MIRLLSWAAGLCSLAFQIGCLPAEATRLNRAGDLYTKGEFAEAAAEYRALISEKPDWAAPYLGLGNSLGALKQPEGAIEAYGHAVDLSPGWFEAQFALGATLLESGRSKEALSVLLKAEELRPDDAAVLSHLAISMAEMERHQEAIGYFEHVERICSGCLDARARSTWQRSRERLVKRQ